MAGAGRLDAAKAALLSFVRGLSASDRVALVTSGSKVSVLVPFGRDHQAVVSDVRSLFANGTQPVYPAITRALTEIRSLHDASSINAVVVLSDGAGTSTGYRELLSSIRSEPVTEGTSVRVFTVAYGEKADGAALNRVATLSGGAFYSGGPDDVQDVYRKISSYF
jgi:Ca-activated chloride channel family protein